MSARHHANKLIEGMNTAMRHAVDMNRNGMLDEKELDEFRKYIIWTAIEEAPMEYHASAQPGVIDQLRADAGPHESDTRHPDDVNADRKAIAQKIVANFLTDGWIAGAIDDETYQLEMRKIGREPQHVKHKREARMPGDKFDSEEDAMDVLLSQHDMNENPTPGRGRRTISEDDMDEYVKSRKADQVTDWDDALRSAKRKLENGEITRKEFNTIRRKAESSVPVDLDD
jgi:hypothetical protein